MEDLNNENITPLVRHRKEALTPCKNRFNS
jgi:hypothetical protein